MENNSFESEIDRWNKVYTGTAPEKLPWFRNSFPPEVEKYLSKLDKSAEVLVTGCGAGDTAGILKNEGFQKVSGTDISNAAIEIAKKRFPEINFQSIPTERLRDTIKSRNITVIDWLNLHQIKQIEAYLETLGRISKGLCLTWIYEPEIEPPVKSYVHDGYVYYHKPLAVKRMLEEQGLSLIEEFNFTFLSTDNVHQHTVVGQIYEQNK